MKVYVLIHCSEDDKQIVKMSFTQKGLVKHLEEMVEKRKNDADVVDCTLSWEDEETALVEGTFIYKGNGQAYPFSDEFIIEEYEVD